MCIRTYILYEYTHLGCTYVHTEFFDGSHSDVYTRKREFRSRTYLTSSLKVKATTAAKSYSCCIHLMKEASDRLHLSKNVMTIISLATYYVSAKSLNPITLRDSDRRDDHVQPVGHRRPVRRGLRGRAVDRGPPLEEQVQAVLQQDGGHHQGEERSAGPGGRHHQPREPAGRYAVRKAQKVVHRLDHAVFVVTLSIQPNHVRYVR